MVRGEVGGWVREVGLEVRGEKCERMDERRVREDG